MCCGRVDRVASPSFDRSCTVQQRARSNYHSRSLRDRNCDSMMCSANCARSNPARPQLGLFVRSFSIRRSAAATRSRARSRSAMVYRRGSDGVRFRRGPGDALLAGIGAFSCFAVAIWPLQSSELVRSDYSALILAARITLAHFSVSASMNFPNTAEVIGIGAAPRSARRAFILASASPAFIS